MFFSGGTALRETACQLAARTELCAHIITPFDSGGSSAALRSTFHMPAVGDMRNRMLALASTTQPGIAELCTLLGYRLQESTPNALFAELVRLAKGRHLLLRQVPEPFQKIIQHHITAFAVQMPPEFPLAGASIGNLVIAAGYLGQGRKLCPAIEEFSRMVQARGMVLPVVEEPAHLAVRLATGQVLVGQHRFTGKGEQGEQKLTAPIEAMWLVASEEDPTPVLPAIGPQVQETITGARTICFPVGSFYSSVLANLLPRGVGQAVAAARCPKVYVPNLGTDPEQTGLTLRLQVERLLATLLADAPGARPQDMLTTLLVDAEHGDYAGGIPFGWLQEIGVQVVNTPLVTRQGVTRAHAVLLAGALLPMAGL